MADAGAFTTPIQRPTGVVGMMVLLALVLAFAWITVALRMYTRASARTLRWDDFWMFFTALLYTVLCSSVAKLGSIVGNKDVLDVSEIEQSTTWLYVNETFYVATMITLKLSLGLFFLRIVAERWQKWLIYIVVGISTTYGLAYIFVDIFQCGYVHSPLEAFTRFVSLECLSRSQVLGLAYTHTTIQAASDWLFALLPLAILRNSMLKRREKVTVCFILLLACLGGIASCIRYVYLDRLAVPSFQFWAASKELSIWTILEPGLGIIAGSLATLRPLLRRLVASSRDTADGGVKASPEEYTPRFKGFDERTWGTWTIADSDKSNPSTSMLEVPAGLRHAPQCSRQCSCGAEQSCSQFGSAV